MIISEACTELPVDVAAEKNVRRALAEVKTVPTQLNPQFIMNSLRIARTALRVRPAAFKAALARRGYAEAVTDKVRSCPQTFQPLLTSTDQVELGSSSSGMFDMQKDVFQVATLLEWRFL